MTNDPGPMVPLGNVLHKSETQVEIQPDRLYRQVTVRLWGGGVVLRDEVSGAKIAAKRRYVVRPQQFILSRIDARNGAFGLVPEFLDGAVVSNDFPAFNVDKQRLEPGFLEWMSKTREFVGFCQAASEGTTNRVRLQVDRFLATNVPLPPLEEQRRIVARIEELAGKGEAARGLRDRAVEETEALLASAFGAVFQPKQGWSELRIGDFCDKPQYGYTASAIDQPIGPRLLRITDIQNGQVNWKTVPFCDCPTPEKYLLQKDDILFARTGATTGKSFLVRDCPESVFASYLIRLRVGKMVTAEYLYKYFQSPQYWSQIIDEKEGTGQANVNGRKLSNIRVLIPSPDEQRRIVAYLDGLQAQVDAVKRLQAATAAELAALLPSILDRAFKGEL
ncbi:MAG: restriction endonuclease subunit S [Chloroflexi bacterium]|nr:restriction endonuclease subunit S [Chloroflexota bacterium]